MSLKLWSRISNYNYFLPKMIENVIEKLIKIFYLENNSILLPLKCHYSVIYFWFVHQI